MTPLILEQDQFIRSVEVSKNDIFSVLLGAGASVTSGIPSAAECIWEWKRTLYISRHNTTGQKLDIKTEQVRTQLQQWLDNEGAHPSRNHDSEYAYYIEECYPIEEDRRKFFHQICDKKQPSISYKLLCLLHELGLIKSVWTTNFDDLGINAAKAINISPIDITLDSISRINRAQNTNELLYIKLHGDYKYGPLKNTPSELATQDETLRLHMIQYLWDKHLIVTGYSGRDNSVMDTLYEAYKRPGAGRLYWCGYGRNINERVQRLIETARANGRTAYYVPTDGFDKLFISLADSCTKNSEIFSSKYRDMLSVITTEDTTAFTVPDTRIDMVIKSNLLRIGFPQEIFQFEYPFTEEEKPWTVLRELTSGKQVIAVPFKKQVYAIGTLSDINHLFADRIKGKITRVPLDSFNIQKDTALYSLLLSGITDLLGNTAGLPNDKRHMIWKTDTKSQNMINDVIYQTHEAIRLAINFDGKYHYLSLMPDFKISSENKGEKINKNIVQEIGLSYFKKIHNDKFNLYIKSWQEMLLGKGTGSVDLEYPINSGSGMFFKIEKANLFAGIMKQQPGRIALSAEFNKTLIKQRGVLFPEPELVFAPRHNGMRMAPTDFHPMRGVSENYPYDYNGSYLFGSQETIRLGVICPEKDTPKFKQFLAGHLKPVAANGINKAYLLSFPGFQQAFSTQLSVPDPGTENWVMNTDPGSSDDIRKTATELRNGLLTAIEKITRDDPKKVVVIYIPLRWLDFTSYDIENEQYDLHDYIKAWCAERGIATQFIKEDTLTDHLQCQINWWLSLSYFVKSLRTPWILDSLDKDTAFAGIGYSVHSQGDRSEIVLGCSHIYNSLGQGLKYRLSKVEDQLFWDRQKRPHLSYKDAYRFGISIIEMFYRTMDEFPKRVVVHKRTFFTQDEINGLKDSLLGSGIQTVDLIEINFEDDMRFVASKLLSDGTPEIDNYALPRGTCVLLNKSEALLWTHGVVQSVENQYYKFYLGGRYIPGPLRIRKHFGKGDLGMISKEILGLTKMNWNSFDLYSQLPATVNSSNEIARIGKLLTKKEGVTYDYRYFI